MLSNHLFRKFQIMKNIGLVIFILLFSCGFSYGQEYTLIDLGTLGGETSCAYGINDSGQIVGIARTVNENSHPFIWQDGTMTDLGTGPAAWSINNFGQIVGGSNIWKSNIMESITMPPEYNEIRAYDINDAEQVVGMRNSGSGHRAFLWEDGSVADLGDLGGSQSEARGINNVGQIVGWSRTVESGEYNRAFLWQDNVMSNLGTLGGNESAAFDINDQGHVVGYSRIATGEQRAFLWQDGTMEDIGSLGGFECVGYSINENDQVVGYSSIPGSSKWHAFIWENHVMTDLNDLIPESLNWTLVEAWDINNNGWIVGWGEAPDGSTNGFLLVPEPYSIGLLVFGLVNLLNRRIEKVLGK